MKRKDQTKDVYEEMIGNMERCIFPENTRYNQDIGFDEGIETTNMSDEELYRRFGFTRKDFGE